MEKNNLVIMLKYENKDSIYPAEQITVCPTHYNEEKAKQDNYNIIKLNSSIPEIWCEVCNPAN